MICQVRIIRCCRGAVFADPLTRRLLMRRPKWQEGRKRATGAAPGIRSCAHATRLWRLCSGRIVFDGGARRGWPSSVVVLCMCSSAPALWSVRRQTCVAADVDVGRPLNYLWRQSLRGFAALCAALPGDRQHALRVSRPTNYIKTSHHVTSRRTTNLLRRRLLMIAKAAIPTHAATAVMQQ